MRRAWLAVAVLVACSPPNHGADRVEVRAGDDCVLCHRADALAVVEPSHTGVERCGDCHVVSAWRPAVGGVHPEDRFALAGGAHQVVRCRECHDAARGSSAAGANTICTLCHTGAHARAVADAQHGGIPDYAFDTDRPSFCLSCHPAGVAFRHEEHFPIRSGAHRYPCLDCHVPERGPWTGGQNTDCVGCHTGRHARSVVDRQHGEVRGYSFDAEHPNFCLRCHPRGRGGD